VAVQETQTRTRRRGFVVPHEDQTNFQIRGHEHGHCSQCFIFQTREQGLYRGIQIATPRSQAPSQSVTSRRTQHVNTSLRQDHKHVEISGPQNQAPWRHTCLHVVSAPIPQQSDPRQSRSVLIALRSTTNSVSHRRRRHASVPLTRQVAPSSVSARLRL